MLTMVLLVCALQSSVGAQAQVEATIYNARLTAWLKGVGFYY